MLIPHNLISSLGHSHNYRTVTLILLYEDILDGLDASWRDACCHVHMTKVTRGRGKRQQPANRAGSLIHHGCIDNDRAWTCPQGPPRSCPSLNALPYSTHWARTHLYLLSHPTSCWYLVADLHARNDSTSPLRRYLQGTHHSHGHHRGCCRRKGECSGGCCKCSSPCPCHRRSRSGRSCESTHTRIARSADWDYPTTCGVSKAIRLLLPWTHFAW